MLLSLSDCCHGGLAARGLRRGWMRDVGRDIGRGKSRDMGRERGTRGRGGLHMGLRGLQSGQGRMRKRG